MVVPSFRVVRKLEQLLVRAERNDKSLVIYPCYEDDPYVIQAWEADDDGIELTYADPAGDGTYYLLIPGRLPKAEIMRFEIQGLDEDDEYFRIALISNQELQASTT